MHPFLSQTFIAGGAVYWSNELDEKVKDSSANTTKTCRQSPRVQSKQQELNHRWSHGVCILDLEFNQLV